MRDIIKMILVCGLLSVLSSGTNAQTLPGLPTPVDQGVATESGSTSGDDAQFDALDTPFDSGGLLNDLQLGNGSGLPKQDPYRFTATLRVVENSQIGELSVKAELDPGWHIYSVTQTGSPGPTKIEPGSDQLTLISPFHPSSQPISRVREGFSHPLEEHDDEVTWTAQVKLADNVVPDSAKLEVVINSQVCSKQCMPLFDVVVPVQFVGYYQPPQVVQQYKAEYSHATLRGWVEPKSVKPEGQVKVVLEASMAPKWHIYAYADKDPVETAKPTLIVWKGTNNWKVHRPTASSKPIKKVILEDEPPVEYHDGKVQWTILVDVPADAKAGEYSLDGLMGYQTCSDSACDLPSAVAFHLNVVVAGADAAGQTPVGFSETKDHYGTIAKLAAKAAPAESNQQGAIVPQAPAGGGGVDLTQLTVEGSKISMPVALLFAFGGGFLLNFMPCVLPVIGLKVMSFVQQGGESKSRAFALNMIYVAGMLTVFLILASLTAGASFAWGTQNQSLIYNVVMASVVFAMALSFLGVWEIPIPGFVGSGAASKAAAKEGLAGAYLKGIITTILAVPCTGPLMPPAMTWCIGKPAPLIYLVFLMLGLGMALPYIVIGFRPSLVRFLPKPGAWMDTFKQLMGFVLLGTVIWLVRSINMVYLLPTFLFLIGLWFACWTIGKIPYGSGLHVRIRGWASAIAVATLVGLYAFTGFIPSRQDKLERTVDREIQKRIEVGTLAIIEDAIQPEAEHTEESELPWESFTVARLTELTAQNKTVMVDFTADWCPNCKYLEAAVLNTKITNEKVMENGVVPLVADWTERDQEIGQVLKAMKTELLPVLAIFPAGRPNEPIVLSGVYTRNKLLEKLDEAGPSANIATGPRHQTTQVAGRVKE